MKTAYDLLMTAPDEQIIPMRFVWKAIDDGDWNTAETTLREVAAQTDGQFSADCLTLAKHCAAQACQTWVDPSQA